MNNIIVMTPGKDLFFRLLIGLCVYLLCEYIWPDHRLNKYSAWVRVLTLSIMTLLIVFVSWVFMVFFH